MILVLGTTTVDLMITGINSAPNLGDDEFTSSNLAFLEDPLLMSLGGNGANSAYVAARLGASAGLFSAHGDDAAGRLVLDWLKQAGVQTKWMAVRADRATATTTILMDQSRNRQSYYHPGALHHFGPEALPEELPKDSSALLISGYTLLPSFRPEGFQQLLAQAKRRNLMTAFDLGPAIGNIPDLAELSPLLSQTDYLICNDYELATISGVEQQAAGLSAFFDAGANQIILKQGEAGASWHHADGRSQVQAAYPTEATVTIGAGDSFNSGLMLGLTQGFPIEQALQFANATAALVVGSPRGILGGPSRAEVEAHLTNQHGQWPTA